MFYVLMRKEKEDSGCMVVEGAAVQLRIKIG